VEEPVEKRPRLPRGAGAPVRLAHLPLDLVLAQNGRFEACRDAKEMPGGVAVLSDGNARAESVGVGGLKAEPGLPEPEGVARVEPFGVELEAMTGAARAPDTPGGGS
jgi:hypothetical protein